MSSTIAITTPSSISHSTAAAAAKYFGSNVEEFRSNSTSLSSSSSSMLLHSNNSNSNSSKAKRSATGEHSFAEECAPFTIGNETAKTFYSPGYPAHYSKNISCIRVLTGNQKPVTLCSISSTKFHHLAPPGYLLRLDFRDHFNIEPSEECKFDYLEVSFAPVIHY